MAEPIAYRPHAGDTIDAAAAEMCSIARKSGRSVEALFNEIPVVATPESDPGVLASDYRAESTRRHEAYLRSPECAEATRRAKAAQVERDRALAAALAQSPAAFTVTDRAAWDSWVDANRDPYGSATIRYADRWARIMEGRIGRGESVEACAADAGRIADSEGITGHMYGCAGSMLARCWVHGAALARWHRAKKGGG